MSQNIEGKVVVITGASSGLGEAAARHLSAGGATVVLGARRTDRIQHLADELVDSGGKALAVTTDVTDCDQVKGLVDAAVKNYGRIDVMINNAGLMPQAPLERLNIKDWDRTIDVNIKGVLYGIAAALLAVRHIARTSALVVAPLPDYDAELTDDALDDLHRRHIVSYRGAALHEAAESRALRQRLVCRRPRSGP